MPHMMRWDVFISHASEDKDDVAHPLTRLLQEEGLHVWLDENELRLGDTLSGKIDEGLAQSRFGVVILSKHFFAKSWTARELAGLVARQIGKGKVVLPVWHGVDKDYVLQFSPPLADALAVSTAEGLDAVKSAVMRAIEEHDVPSHVAGQRKRRWRHWVPMLLAVVLGSVAIVLDSPAQYPAWMRQAVEYGPTLGRMLAPVGIALAFWKPIGIPANVALILGSVLAFRNHTSGRTLLRATCWIMIFVVIMVFLLLADAAQQVENPLYNDFFMIQGLLCVLSLFKWGILLFLYWTKE